MANLRFVATSSSPLARAQTARPRLAAFRVILWPGCEHGVLNYRMNRMNTLTASASKRKAPVEGRFIKVSMDGTPYLRKVDIKMYYSYKDLCMALEKMFSGFITGQSGLHKSSSKDRLTNSSKTDALKGQEYVLAFMDEDADWMLVGDVPWEVFTSNCRRLRIMRGSDAVGIAPRTIEQTGQNK